MKSSPQFQCLMRLKKFRGYIRESDVQPIVQIEKLEGGALHKIAARIGGLKVKSLI